MKINGRNEEFGTLLKKKKKKKLQLTWGIEKKIIAFKTWFIITGGVEM